MKNDLERIIGNKIIKDGQKVILVALLGFPDGATIYQLLDAMGRPRTHRKFMQRNFGYLVAKGMVSQQSVPSSRGAPVNIYRLGAWHDTANREGSRPHSEHGLHAV